MAPTRGRACSRLVENGDKVEEQRYGWHNIKKCVCERERGHYLLKTVMFMLTSCCRRPEVAGTSIDMEERGKKREREN